MARKNKAGRRKGPKPKNKVLSRVPEQGGDEEDQARHSNAKLMVSWDIWASAGLECPTSVELGTWLYNQEQRELDILATPPTERETRLMQRELAQALRANVAKEAAKTACLRARSQLEHMRQKLALLEKQNQELAKNKERQRTHLIAQRKKAKEVAIAAAAAARQRRKRRQVLRWQRFRIVAAEAARIARHWVNHRTQHVKWRLLQWLAEDAATNVTKRIHRLRQQRHVQTSIVAAVASAASLHTPPNERKFQSKSSGKPTLKACEKSTKIRSESIALRKFCGKEQLGNNLVDSDSNLRGCGCRESAEEIANATDDETRYERCARSKPALKTSAVVPPTKTAGVNQGVADKPPEQSSIVPTFADRSTEIVTCEIEKELEKAISDIQKCSENREELESLDEEN